MTCLNGTARNQGVLLADNYDDAIIAGAFHISEGTTSYAAFARKLAADFGPRVFPYIDSLWKESKELYESSPESKVPGAPKIAPQAADFLPDFQSWKSFTPAEVEKSLIDSAARLAKEGKILPVRQIDSKPWAMTEQEAKQAGFTQEGLQELKRQGLSLDVITAGIEKLAGEAQARAHAAADMAQKNPYDPQAKLEAVQALKLADMMTLESIKNKTELGRGLAYLKSIKKVTAWTPTAEAFEKMFGQSGAPRKPLDPGPDAMNVAEAAAAPSDGRAEPLEGTKKARNKPRLTRGPVAAGTSIFDNMTGLQDSGSMLPAPRRLKTTADTPPPLSDASKVSPAAPTPARVRSVATVIKETPHLSAKLAQARDLVAQGVRKLGSQTNAVLPGTLPIPPELLHAAKLYAEAYLEAGVTSFSEFVYHVRSQVGHTADDLPDFALANAWKDAGGQGSGKTSADQTLPAPSKKGASAPEPALSGMDVPPPLSAATKTGGSVRVRTGGDAPPIVEHDVARVGSQAEADLQVGRSIVDFWQKWQQQNADKVMQPAGAEAAEPARGRLDVSPDDTTRQREAVDRLGQRAQALAPAEGGNAEPVNGRLDVAPDDTTRARQAVDRLMQDAKNLPQLEGGDAAPENGRLAIEDTSVTQRRRATDRLGEQAAQQGASDLAGNGGGEAGTTGEDGQTAMHAEGAGSVPLFLPDRAEAVRQRLVDEYESPNLRRDTHIPAMLTEVGGYLYQQGVTDFPEWCVRMNGAVGQKIAAPDLVNAYEQIRPEAFKRVRGATDIRKAAIKRAWEMLDTKQANEAIDRFADVDPKAPDAAQRYQEILREYRKYTPADYLKEVPGLVRALQTSFDISAPFRQGLILTLSRPKQSIPAFWDMLKAFKHKDFGDSVMREIDERDNAPLYDSSGLARTKTGGNTVDLTQREESFMTNLIGDLAEQKYSDRQTLGSNVATRFVAKGIDASERAYAVYLNRLRADVFDDVTQHYVQAGYTPEVYPEIYRATANWINDATGRSRLPDVPVLGDMEKNAKLLSQIFFSARFQQSRVNVLTAPARLLLPESKGGYAPLLRVQVARDLAGATSVILSLLGLARLAGATVEKDWRSSDFAKARFGNTRVDVMGGLQQWIHLVAQLITGQRMNSHGRIVELNGKGMDGTRASVVGRFAESKLSPALTIPIKIGTGQDYVGNTVYRGTPGQIAGDAARDLSPLYLGDMADGFQQEGARGALLTLLQLVGIGVATYNDRPPLKR